MRARNLPTIDPGYWTAIVAASMCGTNAGDLAAGPLGLGHVRGMLPIAVVFLTVVLAEKAVNWTTVAFYWLAIILLRTMATNSPTSRRTARSSHIRCSWLSWSRSWQPSSG